MSGTAVAGIVVTGVSGLRCPSEDSALNNMVTRVTGSWQPKLWAVWSRGPLTLKAFACGVEPSFYIEFFILVALLSPQARFGTLSL